MTQTIALENEIKKLVDKKTYPEGSPFFNAYDKTQPTPTYDIFYGGLNYRSVTIDTEQKLQQLLNKFRNLERKFIAFDTETEDLGTALVGMSFSIDGEIAYYVPVGHDFGVQLDKEYVMGLFKPFFEDPAYTWICWNFAYEYMTLKRHHKIKMSDSYHDAMLIANETEENLPKGLKARSAIELGLTNTQDFRDIVPKGTTTNNHSILKVGVYATQDAILTFRTYKVLIKSPHFKYAKRPYLDCERPVAKWFAEMSLNGIKIAPEVLIEVKTEGKKLLKEIETEIYYEASFNPETGEHEAYKDENGEWQGLIEFNIGSPKQMGEIMFGRLKLPVYAKTKAGKPSLNATKALPLYIRDGIRIAELLGKRNKVAKILSNYTDKLINVMDDNGRIYPSYNQIGAKTGRASASNPPFQQMPSKDVIKTARSIREAFVARDGYKLIVCDFSQLEMRVLAHFSKDKGMMEIFFDGVDMHTRNAAIIEGVFYNKPITYDEFKVKLAEEDELITSGELNKADAYYTNARSKAKMVGFKINYGGGKDDINKITTEFVEAYYKAIPEVKRYKLLHEVLVEAKGYTYKLMGGKRRTPEVKDPVMWKRAAAHRQSFSAHIQGSAADLMKLSMINIGRWLESYEMELRQSFKWLSTTASPCYMVAQVHDEIVLECHEDHVPLVMEKVQWFMENCLELNVPLEAVPSFGNNWAEAK